MNVQLLIWLLIGATGVVDFVLFAAQGMTIAMNWYAAILLPLLCGLAVLLQDRLPPVACLIGGLTQLAAFTQVGSCLTYAAMATTPFPLADELLSHADAALGFDWLAWFHWVMAHPAVHFVLSKAYGSVPFQVLALLVYFAYVDATRIDEAVLATIFSGVIVTIGMVVLPAVGAWTQHDVGIVEPWRSEILALRSHSLLIVGKTQGIVAFPSFHTAVGVLLANMARGSKWFPLVLLLNVIMIVAVMTEGAHYGVDMLSGLAVAWAAIAASRASLVWCQRRRFGVVLDSRLINSPVVQ